MENKEITLEDLNTKVKELQIQLKKLAAEGIKTLNEREILIKNTPDTNLPYESDNIIEMFQNLTTLEKELQEKNIYNQVRKSMSYLEEALEYETNIGAEINESYVKICHLALKELENGLSIMTTEMANNIYKTIYKILKVEMHSNNITLFEEVSQNENHKKYINELIKEDIEYLTNAPFIKSKELIALNKAVSKAEVNISEESRLVDSEVLMAIVECYYSDSRRKMVKEELSKTKESVTSYYENSRNVDKNIENMLETRDKVNNRASKASFKMKLKQRLAAIAAVLSLISATGITIKAVKNENLTISNYIESIIPASGVAAFGTLMFSSQKDKKTRKILESELSSVDTTLNSLNNEFIATIYKGFEGLNEIESLEYFMTTASSYITLSDEERELLEGEPTYTKVKEYFESKTRKLEK